MSFSQLNYSQRKSEKEALASLLDEYFTSRAASQSKNTPQESQSQSKAVQPSFKAPQNAPIPKAKPPVPTSRAPSATSEPKPTPLPRGPPPVNRNTRPPSSSKAISLSPPPLDTPPRWARVMTRFEYPSPDHSSPGIDLFNRFLPHPINELHTAAVSIFEILWPDSDFTPKNVNSPVKLIMRDMDGVAHAANSSSYTGGFTGQASSNVTHHSDFVFSTKYLTSLENHSDTNPAFEIRGVIFHELTHTFQYSAQETPGGLIEGIADFVRLRGGYAAKHWTENPAGKTWDQGYETTAYFLDWVDKNIYEGIVAHVNEWLGKNVKYDQSRLFDSVMPGWSWEILWEQYLAQRQLHV